MTSIPPNVIRGFSDRQALLWVCQRFDLRDGQDLHDYDVPSSTASLRYRKESAPVDTQLAHLYWEAIWLEGAQSPLLTAIRHSATSGSAERTPILLASPSDVEARVPSEEFLALRVLPGVIDAKSPLDAQYGQNRARIRERTAWDLASQLKMFQNRVLVVIGARRKSDLNRLFETLEDVPEINLSVLVVWPDDHPPEVPALPTTTIQFWRGTESELTSALSSAGVPQSTQTSTWHIRAGSGRVSLGPKDVKHIRRRFDLLTESDVLPPAVLTMEDLQVFLRGDLDSWRAYAAGLPVPRAYRSGEKRSFVEEVEYQLRRMVQGETENLAITVQLPAEGGAGATTLLRAAAHRMAAAGFPTLVLRPDQVDIELDHILAFSDALAEKLAMERTENVPLLVASDIEQGAIPSLKQIPQLLVSRGRKILLLQIVPHETGESDEKRTRRLIRLLPLMAESEGSEAAACQNTFSTLASRWNLPLEPKTLEEWRRYESATTFRRIGEEDQNSSLFWVALRYFLVEGLTEEHKDTLQQEIGAWIDKRMDAIKDPSMKRLLDFVAVLSSFRIAAPLWTALRPITGGSVSSSLVSSLRSLQDVVRWGPVVEELGDQTLRFAHPALADHYLLAKGLRDTVSKLELLDPVLRALSGGHPADVWLAESIVMEVIVPNRLERRPSDWEWRLHTLGGLPAIIRDQSKAILHHWARCLYQSADDTGLNSDLKKVRIEQAIEKLQSAIKLPRRSFRDEHPSHLYNTLGTAYARCARLHEQLGEANEASRAWSDARNSFQTAINLGGGTNVEALVAFSFRLVDHAEQSGSRDRAESASDMAHALDLTDEAESILDEIVGSDPDIEEKIVEYRARALNWLNSGAGIAYIRELQKKNDSDLGFYCEARLQLGTSTSVDALSRSLEILKAAKQKEVRLQPRSLRLYLSLLKRHPQYRFSFEEQKATLQQLESSVNYHVRPIEAFQHAVLCYQLELFNEGSERFRKLREQTSRSGNAPPRVREIWRDRRQPEKPRLTSLKVTRVLGEWRGEAFVYDLSQRVPVRPRQFSPALRLNDVVQCVVRFEFFGPLAAPPRLEGGAAHENGPSRN